MGRSTITVVLVASVLFGAATASATGLMGSNVTLGIYAPDTSTLVQSQGSATVTAAVEYPSIGQEVVNNVVVGPAWTSDIGNTTIELVEVGGLNVLASGQFHGFIYSFTGAPAIASVSLDASSTLVPVALWSSSNSVFIDYAGMAIFGPKTTLVNVFFVPEPTAIVLNGMALGCLLLRRRRM